MYIALLLHFYQPPTQYSSMVKKVAQQSYEKVVGLLEKYPKAKITVNINASLTEQLVRCGLKRLVDRIRDLSERGQIELVSSAAYHPILPDLPKREISRQINLNNLINQSYYGSAYKPSGFFSPELAYEEKVGEVVEKLGYRWMLVDGTGIADWRKFLDVVYKRKGGRLLIFPREDEISTKIAFGRIKTRLGLIRAIGAKNLKKRQYMVLAMDGETFGHHLPKQIGFLQEMFKMGGDDKRVKLVTIVKLLKLFKKRVGVEVLDSTWGYKESVDGKKIWVRWRNPLNPVHLVLNELRELSFDCVHVEDHKARELLDRALNSDTYWWSSGKPYWFPGMVLSGAELFYKAIRLSKSAKEEQKRRAKYLFHKKLRKELKRMRTKVMRKTIFGSEE